MSTLVLLIALVAALSPGLALGVASAATGAPVVLSVTSTPAEGTYKAGDTITVQVAFDQAVTVNGVPALELATGGVGGLAPYVAGSGSNLLKFRYTVRTWDTSPDLDYTSPLALSLQGGRITGALNGDVAILTLPGLGTTGSLGENTEIVVDGVAPRVTSVAVPANRTYSTGQHLDFFVTFDEAVTVTDTPTIPLTLATGGTVQVPYVWGTGTSRLQFRYVVRAGHVDADGPTLGSAIQLIGDTVRDAAGNDAVLTLNGVGSTAGVIVAANPEVVEVTSAVRDGSYGVGAQIDLQVVYDQDVEVTGKPTLLLETGLIDRVATYTSMADAKTLTFRYTVQAGDHSADLDYQGSTAMGLNTGGIKSPAGKAAILSLPSPGAARSLGANKAIVIDGSAPIVASVAVPANGTYRTGDPLDFKVTFDEAVTVTGTPTIALTLDTGGTVEANYLSGAGTKELVFRYVVAAGNADADGPALGGAIQLNGGTVRDAAGNGAALALNGAGSTSGVIVSGVGANPRVVHVTSAVLDGSYGMGAQINLQLVFDQEVKVTGVPTLLLETGSIDRLATFMGMADDKTLTFRYTVQAGDTSPDLDYASSSALALSGGTIKSASNKDAILTVPALGAVGSLAVNKSIVIDGIAPRVTYGTVPATGTYGAGQSLDYLLNFSETVVVDTTGGTPRLLLTLAGGRTVAAEVQRPYTGTSLRFRYTVQPGDAAPDGISLTGGIDANGGDIRDEAGNPADLFFLAGATPGIRVDGTVPTVTKVGVPADATYQAGQHLDFTVSISEAVVVDTSGGTPRLALVVGGQSVRASYVSQPSPTSLVFRYTVPAGLLDDDGIGIGDLDVNGGRVRDLVGNNLDLRLNGVGATTGVRISSMPSTIAELTHTNATYGAGQTLRLRLNLSEAATLTGVGPAPYLALTVGAASRRAVYQGGAGTKTLTFDYVVQPGDLDTDGIGVDRDLVLGANRLVGPDGRDVSPRIAALGDLSGVRVDTVAPMIVSVDQPAAGNYQPGQALQVVLHLDEAVDVDLTQGSPTLPLRIGDKAVQAALVLPLGQRVARVMAGSPSARTTVTSLRFQYVVRPGDAGAVRLDGPLALNGARIVDAGGNAVTWSVPGTAPSGAVVVPAAPHATPSLPGQATPPGHGGSKPGALPETGSPVNPVVPALAMVLLLSGAVLIRRRRA